MSRIYDALQRADLERQAAQGKDAIENPEPYFEPGSEDLPPVEVGVSLEKAVMRSWKPSLVSLPTLGDRGEGIEQFRALRTQFYQFRDQNPLKTILVSSGAPAEGKTFVVANLAVSLARNRNNTVLLIDADLRRPALHAILGAPSTPGLTEYLAGTAEVSDILQRNDNPRIVEGGNMHAMPDLAFIPAGAGGDNSSELVANHRIEELVAALSPHFDWILIDSPPVLAFADAIDLARAADAVLLVARGASTPFDVAQRAQAAFASSRILGYVLNAVKETPRRSSYYYDYGKQDGSIGPSSRKDKRRQG
ncbi:MAG: CpsD/CapB family tyrosine-protein kinase [Terracidiphilus sp.]|jgi:capsular exopolysaccharide synthesis family protein